MKRIAEYIALGAVLGALATLVYGRAAVEAQDAGEIKLGAFMPLSGISADVGAQIKAGAEVAAERPRRRGSRSAASRLACA